jgi:Arc/MetJ-type ribon-helix-helix transcriptional regulator
MTLNLTPKAKKLIDQKIRQGMFQSPEEVVLAALAALNQNLSAQFDSGELDAMLAEGEASIRKQGTIDGARALATRRKRRARRSRT